MRTLLTECDFVDVSTGELVTDAAILIDGDRIADAGHAAEVAPRTDRGVTRIELGGATVIPGLWDSHIHLGAIVPPHDHSYAAEAEGEYMLRALRKVQDNLRSGVTSLRALGDKHDADLRLRSAIERGVIEGSRIFASGEVKWSMRGGGEDEFRRKVRERIQSGVDQIKIIATGGIPSRIDNMDYMTCTERELRAAVEEAHRWNKPVAVHAMGDESISIAAGLGVDTVEHGFTLQGEGVEALARSGAVFCPNLAVTDAWNPDALEDGVYSEYLLRNATEARKHHHKAFRRAVELGVPIIAGVDNLPEPNGPIGIERHRGRVALVEELRLMLKNGLEPRFVLAAATSEAARAARVDHLLGTIEAGKYADLVVVAGNPLDDLDALLRVEQVWKAGEKIRLNPLVRHEETQEVEESAAYGG